jgi:hypothetical protein
VIAEEDWKKGLIEYIKDPSSTQNRKVKHQALKYTIIDGKLFHRSAEGLLLRCLSEEEAKVAMGEVYEGLCGTHQSTHKMCWMWKRVGVYWPTMLAHCFKYHKGCEACQKFGVIQAVPASVLHHIIKP